MSLHSYFTHQLLLDSGIELGVFVLLSVLLLFKKVRVGTADYGFLRGLTNPMLLVAAGLSLSLLFSSAPASMGSLDQTRWAVDLLVVALLIKTYLRLTLWVAYRERARA